MPRPASPSSFWVAGIGPVSISSGSEPTRQLDTTFARGVRPRALAFSAVIKSTAPAPSVICEELPAECTPSGMLVLSPARASMLVSRRPSSRSTRWLVSAGLPSSPQSGASRGAIWLSKRESAQARAARSWESSPKASVSARLIPHCLAMRSAPSNWEVNSKWSQ